MSVNAARGPKFQRFGDPVPPGLGGIRCGDRSHAPEHTLIQRGQ
jgi:hypothetical protein